MFLRSLRSTFLEADTRGLAIFRIAFGLVMLGYLVTRITGDSLAAFQTNDGVFPNHYALFAPAARYQWSLLFAFSTEGQVLSAMAVMAVAFVCFTVGYRTKLAQLASFASLLSLHYRMPMIVNASMVLMHLISLWTLALPLGRHFSVDAWLARRRNEPPPALPNERIVSLAVLGFRIQLFYVYFFNVVHKNGVTWRDGSAVHYALWQDRIAMVSAAWLRQHEPRWFSPAATYGTLVLESIIFVCVLLPFFPTVARRAAAISIVFLHVGIGLLVDLGPFPFVLPCAALLLMAGGDWSRFADVARRFGFRGRLAPFADAVLGPAVSADDARGAETPAPPSVPPGRALARVGRAMGEGWNALALVALAVLNRHDNPFLKQHFGEITLPAFARVFGETCFVPQGWSLFAPEAPRLDGLLVVDAVRWDGTHVDPLRHAPPDFQIMEHGPFHTDYFWQTYQPKLVMSQNPDLWRFFVDYLERIPALEAWPGDPRYRSIRVYYVGGVRPPLGGRAEPPNVQLFAERVYVPEEQPSSPSITPPPGESVITPELVPTGTPPSPPPPLPTPAAREGLARDGVPSVPPP